MIQLGRFNTLTVTKALSTGAVLDGGEFGNILLTRHSDSENYQPGQSVNAFVYLDSEGELAATTQAPKAQLGEVAHLSVAATSPVGAFLDWGLPKDLFLPFSEQIAKLRPGHKVLVKLYLDKRNRITATMNLDKHISDDARGLKAGQAIEVIIAGQTDLGYKAVIDHRCWGLLYKSEVFEPLHRGQSLTAYIQKVRDDGRVDLSLKKPGYDKSSIDALGQDILEKLAQNGGRLMLNDKSSPAAIKGVFGVSKKVFKQALGALYKQRLISIDERGISTTQNTR